jgi:UDP-2-acetamido-3-amino-2,3-dideoxy-glucuronate N-acetyltransferase
MNPMQAGFIHPTATVESPQDLGPGCRVWHYAHIRLGAVVGPECIVGKGAYVDAGVVIGARAKLQNGCSVYRGSQLANGVFIGPGAVLTNDRYPRAIGPDGALKTDDDWQVEEIVVGEGASVGAMAVVVAGLRLGAWSMLGAGSVATRDIPMHGLAYGNPARLAGFICKCGRSRAKSLELLTCGCIPG